MKTPTITIASTPQVYAAEGPSSVVNRMQSIARVDGAALTPRTFIETGNEADSRLPPLDIDGTARELERPLWGKKVLYGKLRYPFHPRESLYVDGPYRPLTVDNPEPDNQCQEALSALKSAGMRIVLHDHVLKVPGVKMEDLPVRLRGERAALSLSNNLCPNNPRVRSFAQAFTAQMILDTQPDEMSFDWVEYTNYRFEDNLFCLCDHCLKAAADKGTDASALQRAVAQVYDTLSSTTPKSLGRPANWTDAWARLSPGIEQFFAFKAETVVSFCNDLAVNVRQYANRPTKIRLPGFALPMCLGTGLDYPRLLEIPEVVVETKMYRFHWGLMVHWYAQDLARLAPGTSAAQWIPFAKGMVEVPDESEAPEYYRMPLPDETGPVSLSSERTRLESALTWTRNHGRLGVRVHAYGPAEVFASRLETVRQLGFPDIGIQRYGYMNDEKLKLIAKLLQEE